MNTNTNVSEKYSFVLFLFLYQGYSQTLFYIDVCICFLAHTLYTLHDLKGNRT